MNWNTELLSWPAQCEGDVKVPGVSSRRHCHTSRVCALLLLWNRAGISPLKLQLSQLVLCPFYCTGPRLPRMSWWRTQSCGSCCRHHLPPCHGDWEGAWWISWVPKHLRISCSGHNRQRLRNFANFPSSVGPQGSHLPSNCSNEASHRDSRVRIGECSPSRFHKQNLLISSQMRVQDSAA